MTSKERHEARYIRRKEKRLANRRARSDAIGGIEDVYTFKTVFLTGMKCCNGVRWKKSTQNFEAHLFSRTARAIKAARSGNKWRPKPCVHFTICERGKTRPIDAPHIDDRLIQKVFVNEVLNPLYRPSMIEDNGASQKNKGLHWQFGRLRKHLQDHFRKYGREGAVLLIDLKGFFPNANRELILKRHADLIHDPELLALADRITRLAPEASPGHGMPLGLEVSQMEMIALPSGVDQWIRCQKHIRTMGHYMDDYYIIHHDKEELKRLRAEIIERFECSGIPVNVNKCQIIPLTKSFRFCKTMFRLTESGRIIMNRCAAGMARARRKLKLFARLVEASEVLIQKAREYLVSQRAYYDEYNDHGRVLKLNRLYYAMFHRLEAA